MRKKPIKKSILQIIEFLVTKFFVCLLLAFPLKIRKKITIKIAFILAGLLKKKVNLIKENLRYAFPEKKDNEIEKITRENLENFGKFMAEYLEVVRFRKKDLSSLITALPSENQVYDMLKDGGIVILGHMGNWEWYGSMVSKWFPGHIYAAARKQSNPWTDRLIANMRESGGVINVFTDESFFKFKKIIKEKKLLCLLSDQDAGKNGIFVDFMNRPASTYTGGAILARLTKCPVYFGASWHDGDKLVTHLEPLELPPENLRKNPEEWEKIFTEIWVKKLEYYIKKYPADYFWVHNRWKSKPVEK